MCDVNGWSFVKGNQKYYADCSHELVKMLMQHFGPAGIRILPTVGVPQYQPKCTPLSHSTLVPMFMRPHEKIETKHEELRSVVALFRHGDRTPKQKMKLLVTEPEFLEFFQTDEKDTPGKFKQIKIKTPKRLEASLLVFDPHARNYSKM